MAQGYAHLYGEGRGAAKVWQGNAGLDYLQQAYEQDRKQREKEDAEIQAELSKINFSGVKQADTEYFHKRYKQIKDYRARIAGSNSSDERLKLGSEKDMEMKKLFSEIEQSKQENQLGGELGKIKLTKPDELSDTFTENFKKWNSLSTFDPTYREFTDTFTSNILSPSFDITKLNEGILKKSVKAITPTEVTKRKNNYQYIEKTEGSELDPNLVYKNLELASINDKKILRAIMRSYPELQPKEAVKAYADQLVKDNAEAYRDVKTKEFGGQHDIRPTWSDLHPKPNDGDEKELYTQKLLTGIINGNKEYNSILSAYLPKGAKIERRVSVESGKSKGGYATLRVHIPAVTRITAGNLTVVQDEINEDIPLSKGDPLNRLNAIVSTYGTGLKTSMPKLNTKEGKGKGEVYKGDINNKRKEPAGTTDNTTKIVTFIDNGVEYNIPQDKVAAFKQAKPKAKQK